MPFKIIVAKDEKAGIGLNNKLPWHFKEDMKQFVKHTRGNGKNAVLMGRNTWDSLPSRPLVGRHNLVLTTTSRLTTNNTSFFKNMVCALEYVSNSTFEDVWIIGGEKVYNDFMTHDELNKLVKEVYVTEINGDYGCDTFFKKLDETQYEEISCECVGEKLKFKVYSNKNYAG